LDLDAIWGGHGVGQGMGVLDWVEIVEGKQACGASHCNRTYNQWEL